MPSTEKKAARGWFRRTLLQMEVGACLGVIAWTLAGASIVTWRYRPAAEQAMSCAPSVQSALTDFAEYQLLTIAACAALAVLVGSLGRKKSAQAKSTSET